MLIEVAKEDAAPSLVWIHAGCRVVLGFGVGGGIVHGRHLHDDYCFAEDGDSATSCAASVAKHSIQNTEGKGADGRSGISPDAPYIVTMPVECVSPRIIPKLKSN